MIDRGLQVYHSGPLTVDDSNNLVFNQVTQNWSISTPQSLEYNTSTGDFTILKASSSDYLITWYLSIKTAFSYFNIANNFRFYSSYSGGSYRAGCSSSCPISTGILYGHRLVHISVPSSSDIFYFSIKDMNWGSSTLSTCNSMDIETANLIANATLTIISV